MTWDSMGHHGRQRKPRVGTGSSDPMERLVGLRSRCRPRTEPWGAGDRRRRFEEPQGTGGVMRRGGLGVERDAGRPRGAGVPRAPRIDAGNAAYHRAATKLVHR